MVRNIYYFNVREIHSKLFINKLKHILLEHKENKILVFYLIKTNSSSLRIS